MKKTKILWTDDEIDSLRAHIIFLQEKGFEVVTANNGSDAIELVKTNFFDIIFLDENMPGLSGLQTLSEIKTIDPNVPVVMITKSEEEDIILKEKLLNDPKERAENVMIVDLVRNDLSRTAKKGSVKVEELYGVYSFQQVHQMISTIVSEVEEVTDIIDIIKNAFPMGSMTGAPKIRAMQLMEQYERTKRGLYSGAVGFMTPEKNFDFNVVIRSILYNKAKNYVSFTVGGAITSLSEPDKEYEECMVKAKAITDLFNL